MTKPTVEELKAVAVPVIAFIREHYHPHTKVVIDVNSAEVVEGVMSTGDIDDDELAANYVVQTTVPSHDTTPLSAAVFKQLGLIDNTSCGAGYSYKDSFTIESGAAGSGWVVYSDEYAPALFDPQTVEDVQYLIRLADRRERRTQAGSSDV